MIQEHLDEEFRIAEERLRAEAQDTLALQQPIGKVLDLDLAPLVSVRPDITVAEAVQTMAARRVGCLLVTEEEKLVGLFTERDVLCKVSADPSTNDQAHVSQLMTTNPDTLNIDSPLVFALHRMSVGGYRHVPLLDQQQRPVAVVSMRDVVEHLVALHPNEVLNLPDEPDQVQWRGRDGG